MQEEESERKGEGANVVSEEKALIEIKVPSESADLHSFVIVQIC
jgi:hypothetical protein